MKKAQSSFREIPVRGSGDSAVAPAPVSTAFPPLFRVLGRSLSRLLVGESRPPSILRNNTNLPLFFLGALALSLVCNFALRQSSAQASRYLAPATTTGEVLELVRQNPEDPELHSHLGELYLQQRDFKRAMFHLREASRLGHLADE